jgi:serine/threonine protein kinase
MTEVSSASGAHGSHSPQSPDHIRSHQRQFARDDFEFGSLLGIGALAQVVHVRDTFTSEEYALKILDKKQIKRVCFASPVRLFPL